MYRKPGQFVLKASANQALLHIINVIIMLLLRFNVDIIMIEHHVPERIQINS